MTDNHILAQILEQGTKTYGQVREVKATVGCLAAQQEELIVALKEHIKEDDVIHAKAADRLGSLEQFRARLKGGATGVGLVGSLVYGLSQKWDTVKGWLP